MFGQATETLQGSAANEPRPQVYRNIFQAYGTYVFPVGKGLQVDFGKFASALGFENNYTKDQINYSRSYFFNYLPFYHIGFRTTYPVQRPALADLLAGQRHAADRGLQRLQVAGGDRHDQAGAVGVVERQLLHRAGGARPEPGAQPRHPDAPDAAGLSTDPDGQSGSIAPAHLRHLRGVDARAAMLLGAEGGLRRRSSPEERRPSASSLVKGGAAYAQYRADAAGPARRPRTTYLRDRDGLFSGQTQIAAGRDRRPRRGSRPTACMLRGEWRNDHSDHPFFLGRRTGDLQRESADGDARPRSGGSASKQGSLVTESHRCSTCCTSLITIAFFAARRGLRRRVRAPGVSR